MEIRLRLIKFIASPLSLLCLILILSAKGHLEIIDTEYSVRTALALIEDGSMLIDAVDPVVLEIAPKINETDKIYSQYGLGLVAIFLPIVSVGKLISLILAIDQRIIIDFLISFYNIPPAILGLYFFRSILVRLGTSKSKANLCMLLLFCCTGYWKYSVTDFSEITQVAFLLGAINSLLTEKHTKEKQVSFWLAILVMLKLAYVVLIPIFLGYFVTRNYEKDNLKPLGKKLFNFSLFLIPMVLFLASINYFRFGNIFETGYGSGISFSLHNFKRDWFDYLYSMQRGILPFNPILICAFISWFFIPKNKRFFFSFVGLLIISWFVLMSSWVSFQGGWCWGNRLLIPIIPLILFPIAFLNFDIKIFKYLLFIFIPLSILIQISAVFVKTEETIVFRSTAYSITKVVPPSQLDANLRLFVRKIISSEPNHPLSVLGHEEDREVNFTLKESYHGFNLWLVHLLKLTYLSTSIHFIGIILLVSIIALIYIQFSLLLTTTLILRK